MWRMDGFCVLQFHVSTGISSSSSSSPKLSTAEKLALAFRSLMLAHVPEPEARVTPAVGTPVVPSTADTIRAPPVALTANSFDAADVKLCGLESESKIAPA